MRWAVAGWPERVINRALGAVGASARRRARRKNALARFPVTAGAATRCAFQRPTYWLAPFGLPGAAGSPQAGHQLRSMGAQLLACQQQPPRRGGGAGKRWGSAACGRPGWLRAGPACASGEGLQGCNAGWAMVRVERGTWRQGDTRDNGWLLVADGWRCQAGAKLPTPVIRAGTAAHHQRCSK